MEILKIIENLRDPMGIPFYPFVFQFLMVLTFVLHIFFVNLTLGALFLSFYYSFKEESYYQKLSTTLIRLAPISTAMTILFGIAPLLFVQVLYDPFFYTSSTLLGSYVILFVFIMMIAYTFTYIAYFKKEKNMNLFRIFTLISLILFLFSGFIIHSISYLSLHPEKWISIYAKGDPVNTSGLNLGYFKLSRFLHFIIPSFIATGTVLMLYSEYVKEREDIDKDYKDWVYRLGAKISFYFIIVQILTGIWFIISVPSRFKIFLHPVFILAFLFVLILTFLLFSATRNHVSAKLIAFFSLISLFFMSYTREILRVKYLSEFNYSIFDYKVNIDIGSTLLFLLTFLMGLVIISYLVFVSYKSGKVKGVYSFGEREIKWGKLNLLLMVIWLICVVSLGVYITFKNIM